MELIADPNLIVGFDKADDAGVYKLTDELALIQTVDFFTPIVDDPYLFGQIAAANALSDVYAMGGRPVCAMNIAGFPIEKMDISILREILKGGLDKLREAKVTLAGGHTVEDPELKYGLSVTGLVHPDKVLTNQGARAGDALLLTKRLGTGIVNTAIKGELASPEAIDSVVASMAALNDAAAEALAGFDVSACTDITGFGLLGHLAEMVMGAPVGVRLRAGAMPIFPEAVEYASMGLLPAGLHRNREFLSGRVTIAADVPEERTDLLFDPQTSGGLLVAIAGNEAAALVDRMRAVGVKDAVIVGEVVPEDAGRIQVDA